jgi:small-conductance mechanosensitive channel
MSILLDHLPAIAATASILLSILSGLLARQVLLGRLARLADSTTTQVDDAFVASLKRPLPVWFLLGGVHVALRFVPTSPETASLLAKVVLSAFILSVTFWGANLCSRLLQLGGAASGTTAAPATGVIRYATKIIVLAIGGLVLLSTLGISVTPVLTTMGIGGLAVALGLQETLANLFAGMQITLAGNIRLGDFIKLESGEDGYVEDIQWRATRVRTLSNSFVLIPNSRLAQSVFTNYSMPSKDLAVLIQLGVHYASDLEHVERVVCDVARTIMKSVPGGVPDFEPFIRYHTFGDSSIDFTVILRAQEFTDNFLVKHEFIKALACTFAKEGIVIPFPIRAINLEQEKAPLTQVDVGCA